jgi:hypothetical protein
VQPQIFVLDLATGERRQVTHFPSGTPPRVAPHESEYFLTCCPKFIDNEPILFQTFVDSDGSNPEHNFAAFTVGIDGTRLKPVPTPVALPDSGIRRALVLDRRAGRGEPRDPRASLSSAGTSKSTTPQRAASRSRCSSPIATRRPAFHA